MKLYFSPGACSLSPHIVLREAGLAFDIERVDLKTKTTAGGTDFRGINPKGYVPALQLDDGSVLTEGPAIVQYVADQAPQAQLAPPLGSLARYHLMETLNFISTELHKGFSPLFDPTAPDALKAAARSRLATRIAMVEQMLGESDYLSGAQFTVADAYAFVVLGWSRHVNVDLSAYPRVQAFLARIAQRPAVHEAMLAEGLIKRA